MTTQKHTTQSTQPKPKSQPALDLSFFKAYRSDRTLKSYIRRAFLQEATITQEDVDTGRIKLPDGSEWLLNIEDQAIRAAVAQQGSCPCIISFQVWRTTGACYAFARMKRK